MKLYKFSDFYKKHLLEGGFADVRTQSTIITIPILEEVLSEFGKVIKQFNNYLSEKDIPNVVDFRPGGSARVWKTDKKENPNKEYGDVDVEIIVPLLKGIPSTNYKDEYSTTEHFYLDTFHEFVNQVKPKSVTPSTNLKIAFIIELSNNNFVQIDFIVLTNEFADWAQIRYRPLKEWKGFVVQAIYSALSNLINISFNQRGVTTKLKDGKIVSAKIRKDIENVTISTNPNTFMKDTLEYLCDFYSTKPVMSKLLKSNPGRKDYSEPENLYDIFNSVIGFVESMELSGIIKNYGQNKKDVLGKILQLYITDMDSRYNSTKFDKAETELIKKKVIDIKNMITRAVNIAKETLK